MTNNDAAFLTEPRKPLILIVSGPSGVGKDSLLRRVMERDARFHFVVTMTTRAPRRGETEGIDYLFVSRANFEDLIRGDGFIEYSQVYDDYKGVPREQVRRAMESGLDILMRVDVQGAEKLHRLLPEAILVFLAPESRERWLERFKRRGLESDEEFEKRRQKGESEMQERAWFDYTIVNREGQLDEACEDFLAIVRAEHLRTCHRCVTP